MVKLNSLANNCKVLITILGLVFSVTEAQPLSEKELASNGNEFNPEGFAPGFDKMPSILPPDIIAKKKPVGKQATSEEIKLYTKYAGVSATAYCSAVVPLNSWSCDQCVKRVPDGKIVTTFISPAGDIHGFVLRSDKEKTIYLVFRGTNSFKNVFDDLVTAKVDYLPVQGAKVHVGFYASYHEARIMYAVHFNKQLQAYPDYKVIVTGHSLGAAQALLAGLDLYQQDNGYNSSNIFIHTFGSPRVGDEPFASYVQFTNITYTRSVHTDDVVPHLPSATAGFAHAGVEIWNKSPYDTQICTFEEGYSKCSAGTDEANHVYNILDHLTYYSVNEGMCL